MIRSRSVLQTTACLVLLLGCGAGGTDDDAGTPTVSSFLNPGGGGTSANGTGGTSGAPVGAAPGGGSGTAGQAGINSSPNAAGGTGQGGNSAMEGTGNVAAIDPNATGGTSNASGGNAGGNGPGGTDPGGTDPDPVTPGGGFVSVDVNGGASAAFACPTGVTFGNPLAGMGAIQSVTAPNGSFFAFIEGPMWIGSVNKLFFSDNAGSPERIWQISPPFTTPSVFLEGSGSNGLAVDSQDKLLVADQARMRVTRLDPATGQVTQEIVPTGRHKPNDLVSRSDGNIYFTDPDSAGRGLYRVSPTGELTGPFLPPGATNGPGAPNGVLLSPDENELFVGDVQQRFVATFNLLADGAIDLPSGQVFVRTQGNFVDGMAMDCAGNLYAGTSNGIEVYSPQAALLGTIPTGDSSSNATFGGADRRTLFVTQRSTLKFVTLAVPGLPD
jgi:gluconolactonase